MIRRLFLACFVAVPLAAHPGVGIVQDRAGNIYYTDLEQVWQIQPSGFSRVFVPQVHTHELSIDRQGNIYGEHLWYNGEAANTWGHYVWRAGVDGRVEKVIPTQPGFLKNYGFARDAQDNLYFAERDAEHGAAIKRRSSDGGISTIAHSNAFHDIRWLACAPNGTVYLIDRSDLIRVATDGTIRVLAKQISESIAADQRHMVMGLCADDAGNVYVAVPELRAVKKFNADGRESVVAKSTFPWAPSGVLALRDGTLLILEFTITNQVRVRRLSATGVSMTY